MSAGEPEQQNGGFDLFSASYIKNENLNVGAVTH